MIVVNLQDEHVVALREARRLIWQLSGLGVEGAVSLCDDLDEIIGIVDRARAQQLHTPITGRRLHAAGGENQ